MPEIATVPLNGLVALHLLSKDLLAMTQGVSIKTLDEGEEYTASLDPPPDLRSHLEDLKKNCPQALIMICRLVARSVYLASDLPMAVLEVANPVEPPPLAMVVKEMDVLDELAACEGERGDTMRLLDEPVPLCLKYWNEWNEGHVMSTLKEARAYWSEIREAYLAPHKAVLASAVDPAVAGGMAKGFNSGWQQAKSGRAVRPRRVKKITAIDDEVGILRVPVSCGAPF